MSVDPRREREQAALAEVGLFGSADYELCWPPQLVAYDVAALRRGANARERRERIEFVLEEAFLGETPAQDFAGAASRGPAVDDPWGDSVPAAVGQFNDADDFIDRLLAHLPRTRENSEPAPYWPARHGRQRDAAARTTAAQRFAALVGEFYWRGYFGRTLPPPCVDDYEPVDESVVLAERLGLPDLWPLRADTWDEDTFFGLIEVFHDLAARPRDRTMHSYNGCGWHYSAFSTGMGRALYRWRVAHAIAQFRARAATVHDKRSAVITLAGILEERRELIHDKIGKKDEGALFGIPTSSRSATNAAASMPTTTLSFSTGSSGGTSEPSNSPTG